MTPDERELIRQHLHITDLLVTKLKRKCVFLIEQIGLIQGMTIDIEEEKKPIYELLNKQGGQP